MGINDQDQLLANSRLDQVTRIRIALFLAQRAKNGAMGEALRHCGRLLGMIGAEMTANQQGTSHDAKATACLRFVAAVVDNPQPPSAPDLRCMHKVGYSHAEILDVLAVIAAPGEIVNCGLPDSRSLLAD